MGKKSKVLGASISARSHTKEVTRLITSNLKGNALTDFEGSCFGYLLALANGQLKFQLQLIYAGMLNMSEVKRNKGVPVFCFNNNMIEFTKKDFYLMSGLKFGDLHKPPTSSIIHQSVFDSKENIKYCEIKKAFTDKCSEFGGDDEICLKLALLVFLYGVLLTRDNTDKNIDLRYFHIVDDVDAFNKHPWGVVAYNYLCDSLFHAYDRMMDKVRSNAKGQPKFDVYGFLFCLQCWFYEIMPRIGERMGDRVHGWRAVYPRILRWTSYGVFKYDAVKEMIDDASLVVRPMEADRDHESIGPELSEFLTYEPIDPTFSFAGARNVQRKKTVKRSMPFPLGESGYHEPPLKKYKLRGDLKKNKDEGSVDKKSAPRTRESAPSITTPVGRLCPHCPCQKEILSRMQILENSNAEMSKNIQMMMGLITKLCSSDSLKIDEAEKADAAEKVHATEEGLIEEAALHDVAVANYPHGCAFHEMNPGENVETEEEMNAKAKRESGEEMNEGGEETVKGNEKMNCDEEMNEGAEERVKGNENMNCDEEMNEGAEERVKGNENMNCDEEMNEGAEERVKGNENMNCDEGMKSDECEESFGNVLSNLVNRIASQSLSGDAASDSRAFTPPGSGLVGWNLCLFEKPYFDNALSEEVPTDSLENCPTPVPKAPLRRRPSTRANPENSSSESDAAGNGKPVVENAIQSPRPVTRASARLAYVMYDPLKHFPKHMHEEFKTWYKSLSRQYSSIRLRINNPTVADIHFFQRLAVHDSWLSTKQTDALVQLLMLKTQLMPAQFLRRWTCVQHQHWYYFQSCNLKSHKKALLKFAAGIMTEEGGTKPWSEVDHIYDIGHVNNNHFVAYDIQLKEQSIVVYDSQSKSHKAVTSLKYFDTMSWGVPWILVEAGVRHPSGKWKMKWPIIPYQHPPQQQNGHDCGIFAMKFIECLATGRSVHYVDGDIGPASRDSYCAEFYNSRLLD